MAERCCGRCHSAAESQQATPVVARAGQGELLQQAGRAVGKQAGLMSPQQRQGAGGMLRVLLRCPKATADPAGLAARVVLRRLCCDSHLAAVIQNPLHSPRRQPWDLLLQPPAASPTPSHISRSDRGALPCLCNSFWRLGALKACCCHRPQAPPRTPLAGMFGHCCAALLQPRTWSPAVVGQPASPPLSLPPRPAKPSSAARRAPRRVAGCTS